MTSRRIYRSATPLASGLFYPAVTLLLLLGAGLRLYLLLQPRYAQVQYEEAEFGLIALNILKGKPALFLWGSPYHGVLECYLIALLFKLFGVSTLVLRLEPLLMSVLYMVVMVWAAQRLWDRRTGLYTALLVALPPLYLSTYSALVYPSYLGVIILSTVACVLLFSLITDDARRASRIFLLGLVCGLSFWEHATSIPPLLWFSLVLLISSPAWFTPRRCGLLLLGVFLGGSPLWLWNLSHHFNTFRCLFGGYGAVQSPYSLQEIIRHFLTFLLPYVGGVMVHYWDSASQAPFWRLWYWACYLPILGCWLNMAMAQGRSWWRGEKTLQPEILFLGLVATVLAVNIFSGRITDRYSLNIYAAWPILVALCLVRIQRWRRWPAYLLLTALLILHGNDHLRFFAGQRRVAAVDRRPVDQVIATLDKNDIRYLYGHFRVARVVTFETGERIIGADFHGYKMRMYELFEGDLSTPRGYLLAVDNARRKAILTHKHLGLPYPREMDRYLACLDARSTRDELRHHVIYHDFVDPYPILVPIEPSHWRATASSNRAEASHAFDRTRGQSWHTTRQDHAFFQLDLGREQTVAKIVLDAGVDKGHDYPAGLRIDVSLDGKKWTVIRPDHDEFFHLFPGFDWFNGSPRLTMNGPVGIVLPHPCRCRYLRLTVVVPRQRWYWTIDEIYCYRPGQGPRVRDSDRRAVLNWLLAHPTPGLIYGEPEQVPYLKQHGQGRLPLWDIYRTEVWINTRRDLRPNGSNALFVSPLRHEAAMARVAERGGARWQRVFTAGELGVYRLGIPAGSHPPLYWSNQGLLLLPGAANHPQGSWQRIPAGLPRPAARKTGQK